MSEKIFYAYIHYRQSDGSIFYVGKGSGRRHSTTRGRSEYWQRIVDKHGFMSQIVFESIVEHDCFELEEFLIAEIGSQRLCNLTTGGEGCSGRIMGESQRRQASERLKGIVPSEAVAASIEKNSKPIATICGMRFTSISNGVRFLRENGRPTATKQGLYSCLIGTSKTAYGYEWRFLDPFGNLCQEAYKPSEYKRKKPVRTICGMEFDSAQSAGEWLRENGFPKAIPGNITQCCKGRVETAYGYRWGYVNE